MFKLPSAAQFPWHLDADCQLDHAVDATLEFLKTFCGGRPLSSQSVRNHMNELDALRAELDELDFELRFIVAQREILQRALNLVHQNCAMLQEKRQAVLDRSIAVGEAKCSIRLPNEILAYICKLSYMEIDDAGVADSPKSDIWGQICHQVLPTVVEVELPAGGVDSEELRHFDIRTSHAALHVRHVVNYWEDEPEVDIPVRYRQLESVLASRKCWRKLHLDLRNISLDDAARLGALVDGAEILPGTHDITIDSSNQNLGEVLQWWQQSRVANLRSATLPFSCLWNAAAFFDNLTSLHITLPENLFGSPPFWRCMQRLNKVTELGIKRRPPVWGWGGNDYLTVLFPPDVSACLPSLDSISLTGLQTHEFWLFLRDLDCHRILQMSLDFEYGRTDGLNPPGIIDVLYSIDAKSPSLKKLSWSAFGLIQPTEPPHTPGPTPSPDLRSIINILSKPYNDGHWPFPSVEHFGFDYRGHELGPGLLPMIRSRYTEPTVAPIRKLELRNIYSKDLDETVLQLGIYVQDIVVYPMPPAPPPDSWETWS